MLALLYFIDKMLKFLKFNLFWFLYAIGSILFSFTIFSNWVLLICIWFGLFFTFRFTQLESKLSAQEQNLYSITIFLYPLVETSLKWMIVNNAIHNSGFWLNRLEHFSGAIAVAIIFLPIYLDIWKNLKYWQNLIFVISFICLVGNLNEFLEYFIRLQSHLTDTERFAAYYWDTIYDMMMNVMGGFMGFVLLQLNTELP
jgi:hypothetical protein